MEIEVQHRSEQAAARALEAAFAAVARVHELMSCQQATSDVARINRAVAGVAIPVHPWTWRLLERARRLSAATGGVFDVVIPAAQGRAPLGSGTWRDLSIRRGARRAAKWIVEKRRALRISLDGIAKGFAVDRAVQALRLHGAQAGLVNAGGDLRCFGMRRYRVAMRRPDPDSPQPLWAFEVSNCALATSGGYFGAAFWNTRNLSSRCSTTVAAPTATAADALTKVVRGPADRATRLLLRRLRARAWRLRGLPATHGGDPCELELARI